MFHCAKVELLKLAASIKYVLISSAFSQSVGQLIPFLLSQQVSQQVAMEVLKWSGCHDQFYQPLLHLCLVKLTLARVHTRKMKSSRVSSLRCRHSIRRKRWALKLILALSWDSKNSHSLSDLRLSSSDRPDTCSHFMPSSPTQHMILSAILLFVIIRDFFVFTLHGGIAFEQFSFGMQQLQLSNE